MDLERVHIPTKRVPIELVLWHLMTEGVWGVSSKTSDWRSILEESLEGFYERRTAD
jgi:hypothetical protein